MTRRFVAELTFVTGGSGATTTFYVASSGFSTKPTDTPAEAYIPSRLTSAGVFSRTLFGGKRVAGGVRPAIGDLIIANDDGAFDAWVGYGVAGGKVTVRMGEEGDAYPSAYTTVFVAYMVGIKATLDGETGKSSINVRVRSRDYLLDRPIVTTSFAGTGGLEGTTAVAGKLKQFVSSDPGFITPILIDASLQLYFVQSTSPGGLAASFKLYEGGVEITRGADYSSASDCTTNAPAAGQCRFWFGTSNDGPVYFRLNAAPTFDLRVQALGYQPGGAAWSFGAMAARAGIAGGSEALTLGAQLIDDGETTYARAMDDACAAQFGYYGMTRLDAFVCGIFDVPGATPLATFDIHNAWRWQREPVQGMEAPVWQVVVDAGLTWPSNLQAAATATLKDYLTRTPVWCSFAGSQNSTLTDNPGADADALKLRGRHFQSLSDQTTFLSGFFTRFGARRDFYQCTVQITAAMLAVELHDTVQIKLPRFGLSAGKNMRVIYQQIHCDKQEITFGLWG